MTPTIRSGFVAVVGRPNVGKSTFLNAVIGSKISITASKPQTTRDRILGIIDAEDSQIIFLDTPGIHESDKALNQYMVDKALSTIADADLVMVMADPVDTPETLKEIIKHLAGTRKQSILVLNKCDLMRSADVVQRLEELGTCHGFIRRLAISSLVKTGIDELMVCLKELLPEGPRFFPDDMITDAPLRFLCRELIREKVFTLTQKEIPFPNRPIGPYIICHTSRLSHIGSCEGCF